MNASLRNHTARDRKKHGCCTVQALSNSAEGLFIEPCYGFRNLGLYGFRIQSFKGSRASGFALNPKP